MNTNTSSVYSYINNSINYYKWIMIKLSPELKDYIISYCDPINEAIDYFIRLGPSTLYQNRLKGLPVYQNPTILAVPGFINNKACLLYTSPSPRDRQKSRMPSSA